MAVNAATKAFQKMGLSLGEKLRQSREELGISISEVAEQTRISPLYIKSIENDDYRALPGGIFNKGFIKSYAKYIGFDEQEALQDYSALIAETEGRKEDDLKVYRPEVLTDERTAASMAPTLVFAGIILALMTGGVLFLVNYIRNQPGTPPVVNTNSAVNNTEKVNASTPTAPLSTDKINVELRATGEPVWVSYTVDGKTTVQTLEAEQTVSLNANDSLKVSYSKSKLPNLQIILNGKRITPPETTAKGGVEIIINKENLAQLMNAGTQAETAPQTQAASEPSTTGTPTSSPRPRVDASQSPKATPKPETTKPSVVNARPIPSLTPIVVGKPTAAPKKPN